MSKETYTFSEILFGLRDEYIKKQKLINELKKYILIDGVKDNNIRVYTDSGIYSNNIKVAVLKEQSELAKMTQYLLCDWGIIEYLITAHYYIRKVNDDYKFEVDGIRRIPEYNISVIDNKSFNEIVTEILNTKIMALRHFYAELNPFQTLCVDHMETAIYGDFKSIKPGLFSVLKYDSETDSIKAIPDVKDGTNLITKLFNTAISKDSVPEEYRKIIDASIRKYGNLKLNDGYVLHANGIFINDVIDKRCELGIDMQPPKIVLTKKRKLKFYE